jgi:hypothetical protein
MVERSAHLRQLLVGRLRSRADGRAFRSVTSTGESRCESHGRRHTPPVGDDEAAPAAEPRHEVPGKPRNGGPHRGVPAVASDSDGRLTGVREPLSRRCRQRRSRLRPRLDLDRARHTPAIVPTENVAHDEVAGRLAERIEQSSPEIRAEVVLDPGRAGQAFRPGRLANEPNLPLQPVSHTCTLRLAHPRIL